MLLYLSFRFYIYVLWSNVSLFFGIFILWTFHAQRCSQCWRVGSGRLWPPMAVSHEALPARSRRTSTNLANLERHPGFSLCLTNCHWLDLTMALTMANHPLLSIVWHSPRFSAFARSSQGFRERVEINWNRFLKQVRLSLKNWSLLLVVSVSVWGAEIANFRTVSRPLVRFFIRLFDQLVEQPKRWSNL